MFRLDFYTEAFSYRAATVIAEYGRQNMMLVFEWCFWLFVCGLSARFLVTVCRLAAGLPRGGRRPANIQPLEFEHGEEAVAPKWKLHHFLAAGVVIILAMMFLPISLGFSVGNGISRIGQWLRMPSRQVKAAPLNLPITSIDYRKAG